ncbi:hypothetical protein BDN71DRAFT_1514021 [Pleurotus eryngii]|uniref:Uncharacterized protein n=1 Tax=Pleurotus eryngii TaxID=5323 RepID=A0A9P5ZHX6_PLEER|nr:hypothetical protein BDN71DRAFT_1514021 [Pleurotus eryngii]
MWGRQVRRQTAPVGSPHPPLIAEFETGSLAQGDGDDEHDDGRQRTMKETRTRRERQGKGSTKEGGSETKAKQNETKRNEGVQERNEGPRTKSQPIQDTQPRARSNRSGVRRQGKSMTTTMTTSTHAKPGTGTYPIPIPARSLDHDRTRRIPNGPDARSEPAIPSLSQPFPDYHDAHGARRCPWPSPRSTPHEAGVTRRYEPAKGKRAGMARREMKGLRAEMAGTGDARGVRDRVAQNGAESRENGLEQTGIRAGTPREHATTRTKVESSANGKGKTEEVKRRRKNATRAKRNGADRVSTTAAVLPPVFELKRGAQATLGDEFRDRVGRSPSISFTPHKRTAKRAGNG